MQKRFIVPVEIEELEEGGYLASCPDIQGCHAEGDTLSEALDNLKLVAQSMLEFIAEKGQRVPDGLRMSVPGR